MHFDSFINTATKSMECEEEDRQNIFRASSGKKIRILSTDYSSIKFNVPFCESIGGKIYGNKASSV